jgi:hypothetical protein
MFPRWEYSLFQSWFRRTLAFQKPLAFLSKIINCFTNIFDSKQLKYSPKVHIFALRRENGNSRRNEPLFLVSVDKLPTCWISQRWRKWIKSFEYYIAASGITDKNQQRAILARFRKRNRSFVRSIRTTNFSK